MNRVVLSLGLTLSLAAMVAGCDGCDETETQPDASTPLDCTALGASCEGGGLCCDPGVCSATGTCVTCAPQGGSCAAGETCCDGLACSATGATCQPPTSACVALGQSCAGGKVCCRGSCGVGDICTIVTGCVDPGLSCRDNLDCCTKRCSGGVCSADQCLDLDANCSANSDCCTMNCSAGKCATIPGKGSSCKVEGQACSAPGDCCSTNCKAGFCALASLCRANNDLCLSDLDCCSSVCSKNDGTAGYCVTPSGGCNQDGNPCSGSSNCCTRICSDPGSGATVCMPSSGCKMTGLACIDAQACCGGGSNPNGSVSCVKAVSTNTFGRCDNGTSCNPVGNICGAKFTMPDGTIFSVNASQNCCDGKTAVCKLDSAGIPRCFGGGSGPCPTGYTGVAPCCIEEGQPCQFKDQCCNGAACIPGDDGVLRCGAKSSCVPLGAACTPGTSTCCTGDCLPAGELGGSVCQTPGTSPDAGTTCKPNDQPCSEPIDCCSSICLNGVCKAQVCQGIGDVCTSSGECCSTLSCVIPSGSSSGTCQKAGTCALSGQSCSSAQPCCTDLLCMKAGANEMCDDTSACTCRVQLN